MSVVTHPPPVPRSGQPRPDPRPDPERAARPRWAATAAGVGLVGHLLSALLYLGAPLVAPPAGVVVLWAGWAGVATVALRLRRSHPWLVLGAPVASLGYFMAVLGAGSALFGWTA